MVLGQGKSLQNLPHNLKERSFTSSLCIFHSLNLVTCFVCHCVCVFHIRKTTILTCSLTAWVTKFKHAPHSEIEKIHFSPFLSKWGLQAALRHAWGQKGICVGSWQSLACTELYLIFWFPALRQIEVREPLRRSTLFHLGHFK